MTHDLQLASELAEEYRAEEAWKIVNQALEDDPDDHRAILLACFLYDQQGQSGKAFQFAKRLITEWPQECGAWIAWGRALDCQWRMDDAISAFKRALSLTGEPKRIATISTNMACTYLQLGKFDKARHHANEALKRDPEELKARHNLGLCQLSNREWESGWKNYHASLGSGNRPCFRYGDEEEWNGEKTGTIAVYGEQGIGDEILAASMFSDLKKYCDKLIIDCDERLEQLFKRSFPFAKVYGTRSKKVLNWDDEDHQVDASIASLQAGMFLRKSDNSFPENGKYLEADEDKSEMWRGFFKRKGKPTVGIAWGGGIKQTGKHLRTLKLDDLIPIFKACDAHYVCLQYTDSAEEIKEFRARHPWVDIKQYKYATVVKDYDETAALVSALDCVVSVPTAAVHLSAALGVPTIAMNGLAPCWKFRAGLPFHPNVNLIPNNGNWVNTIKEAAEVLDAKNLHRL